MTTRQIGAYTVDMYQGDRNPVRMWKALETLHLDAVPVGFLPVGEN